MSNMVLPPSSYTSLDLFHLTDQRQCKTCKFKFFKSLTRTFPPQLPDPTTRVTHYFNPHCDVCYRNVQLVQQDPIQALDPILEQMEPANALDKERLGQPLPCPPTREYDSYDYRYCKACHEPVLLFHAEDKESLHRRNLNELVQTKGCEVCSKVTWGNVLAKTYQALPSCGLCGKVLKPEDECKRYCCKASVFHFGCTTLEFMCPKCGSECCIRFTLPSQELDM